MSQLESLTKAPAPKPEPEPKSAKELDVAALAKALGLDKLAPQIEALAKANEASQIATKKAQAFDLALSGIPDQNRPLATLALEGMLATAGVDLSKADPNRVAKQLQTALREQHVSLFSVPGSKYSAIPARPDGQYDWSGVQSLDEVPPGMISKMPKEVWERIRAGGGGVRPGEYIPQTRRPPHRH
jgi:hypothetical protein